MSRIASNISPKFFRGTKTTDNILEELYSLKAAKKPNYIAMGQLVGKGVDHEVVTNQVKNDKGELEDRDSIAISGQFEAICLETGEVKYATTAYLPTYFAKMVRGMIKQGDSPEFAVEIGVELTGRTIPWTWVVADLLPKDESSPLERMKSKLIGNANFKLPPALIGQELHPDHEKAENKKSNKAA